jgi:hypothetical protein
MAISYGRTRRLLTKRPEADPHSAAHLIVAFANHARVIN